MPALLKLIIDKGTTFEKSFVWKSGPQGEELPVDLTGATGRMQIREQYTSPGVLVELATGSGLTFGGADGRITMRIEASATEALTFKSGVYDLDVTFPTAPPTVKRPIKGTVTVLPEVTRD